jgi:hypothetical protein
MLDEDQLNQLINEAHPVVRHLNPDAIPIFAALLIAGAFKEAAASILQTLTYKTPDK